MTLWILLIGIVIGVVLGITLVYRAAISPLHRKIDRLTREKHSLSATYGKITEQFAPFMKHYPYDPQNFRFIGSPIDGIQFEDDHILFIEFKTHTSKLTPHQQNIKQLVKNKHVDIDFEKLSKMMISIRTSLDDLDEDKIIEIRRKIK